MFTDVGTWAPWNTFPFPKYLGTFYTILILPKNTHAIGGKTVVIELRTTISPRAKGIFSLESYCCRAAFIFPTIKNYYKCRVSLSSSIKGAEYIIHIIRLLGSSHGTESLLHVRDCAKSWHTLTHFLTHRGHDGSLGKKHTIDMKQTDNLIFKLGNRTSTSQRGYTSGQNTWISASLVIRKRQILEPHRTPARMVTLKKTKLW